LVKNIFFIIIYIFLILFVGQNWMLTAASCQVIVVHFYCDRSRFTSKLKEF